MHEATGSLARRRSWQCKLPSRYLPTFRLDCDEAHLVSSDSKLVCFYCMGNSLRCLKQNSGRFKGNLSQGSFSFVSSFLLPSFPHQRPSANNKAQRHWVLRSKAPSNNSCMVFGSWCQPLPGALVHPIR